MIKESRQYNEWDLKRFCEDANGNVNLGLIIENDIQYVRAWVDSYGLAEISIEAESAYIAVKSYLENNGFVFHSEEQFCEYMQEIRNA